MSYYVMRSFYSQDAQNRSEYLEEFKNTALETLNKIADGSLDLVDTTGAAVPGVTEEVVDYVSSNTQDFQPFFDIDSPTRWGFDQERKDEVEDAR